ncbi:MAG: hypothetical protein HJJLKODD_01911 [Phycisphaerae bacterium]|nr:hypothetical protein [Phycisphaerae bacterium]
MDIKLLNVAEVAELLGISDRYVWKLLLAGKLPKPIHLGRATRWQSNEIERFIADGCSEITDRETEEQLVPVHQTVAGQNYQKGAK